MSDDRVRDGAAPTVPLSPEGLAAAVASPPVLARGIELAGRYRIERFVARGGMGAVYEAQDRELGVTVALKTVRADVAWGPAAIERFKREIHLARTVTHPGVCRIFDLGRHGELVFLTMELLRGPTLAEELAERGPLGVDEARGIVGELCAALEAAHQAGVVHRDLKPSNVMLVERPRRGDGAVGLVGTAGTVGTVRRSVVITDFGLARAIERRELVVAAGVDGGGSGDVGGDGGGGEGGVVHTAIAGTPGYMAPEQRRGGAIGPATDLYSLGVVMCELVTGEAPPVDGGGVERVMVRVEAIDRRWAVVIRRCLAEAPSERFASASEVMAVLGQPEVTRGVAPRRRLLALVGGPLLVVVIAVAAIGLSRGGSGTRGSEGTVDRAFEREIAEIRGLIEQARYGDAAMAAERVVTEVGSDERKLALALYLLAEARMQHGELVAAEAPLRESIRLAARVGDDVTLASNWVALLRVLSQLGRLRESAMFAEVAEAAVVRAGNDPRLALNLQLHLAATDAWDDRYVKAIERLETSTAAAEPALGASDPDLLLARIEHAEILVEIGRPAVARVIAERQRELALKAFGAEDFRVALADYVRGIAERDLGEFERARPLLEHAVKIADGLDPDHPGRYHARMELGRLHLMAGELEEAQAMMSAAVEAARGLPGPDELRVGSSLGHLADAHHARGEPDEAERLWREAVAMRRRSRGERNVGVGRGLASLGLIAQQRGDAREALRLYEEALGIVGASEIAVYPALVKARLGALRWGMAGTGAREERAAALALAAEARPVLRGLALLPGERPLDLVELQRWLAEVEAER
jgi:tetratricopeptide (TPR) repeat protein